MKPYLSHSQLNMLAKCPKQYEFRYIRGIKSPPGAAMIRGTGVHHSVELNLKEKLATGKLLPVEQVTQLAAEEVRRRWQEEAPALDEEEQQLGSARVMGQTVDVAVALAALHAKTVAPGIAIVAIEEGFRLELDGFPFDILGYKDIREKGRIRDTKTKGKAPSQDEADVSMQLTIYDIDERARGNNGTELQLDTLVANKVPKYVALKSRRTLLDHDRLYRRLEVTAQQLESGIFPPTDPTSWACSEKWCGYWNRCEFGGKQSVSLQVIDPKRLTSKLPGRAEVVEWDAA